MAIMSIGAVVTTTNPLNTAAEIAKQTKDSNAILAFVTSNLAEKLVPTNLPLVVIAEEKQLETEEPKHRNRVSSLEKLIASNPDRMLTVRIRQDNTATLLYSSGTTGMSKGVITTHRNLISMVCIFINRLELSGVSPTASSFMCIVPMFHIYGLSVFSCGLLGSGSTGVVLSKFDIVEMAKAIQKYRVTYLPLVPPILLALTRTNITNGYDLSSLHSVLCAGAPLSKEAIEYFIYKFPRITLMQGYGMTETTAAGTSTDTQEESKHYGTAGMLSPNTEAKIVDPDSGTVLPPNQRGEL